MASKRYAVAKKETCVACGTCLMVCPKSAIEVVKGCFAQIDAETCVGCAKCKNVCPTGCIALVERKGF